MFFFFKQKTAYEMRISDWSSDVCSSDLLKLVKERGADFTIFSPRASAMAPHVGDQTVASEWARRCNDLIYRVTQLFPDTFIGGCKIGRASCRERVCQYV